MRALRISSPEHLQSELDILWSAFMKIGYPHYFIREALSASKTKFYSSPSPSTNLPSTSSTPDPAAPTRNYSQAISLPYHPDFVSLNRFIHASNLRIVFSARNSIGRSVVNKKGRSRNNEQISSGVYQIPCAVSGCNRPYYGRTVRTLAKRMVDHNNYIANRDQSSALVIHMQKYPGHYFDTSTAKLIWKTRNKYECQFIESACISRLPCCNTKKGEITVSPVISAFTTHITGLNKYKAVTGPMQIHGSTPHNAQLPTSTNASPRSNPPHSTPLP